MNFRPAFDEWELWDTWMFPDPDGKRMHLFYLENPVGGHWEWVGHFETDDMLHWRELEHIRVCKEDDSFDCRYIGTGMVFEGPDGEFVMSYTANLGTNQQISFLHSKDLDHWEKRWPGPKISPQDPHYLNDHKDAVTGNLAFRDAFIQKVGDSYEALVCAQAPNCAPLGAAVIARYRSDGDNLESWQAAEPLLGPGIGVMAEVPEHFQLGEKHYLLWSDSSETGVSCDTPSRRDAQGTFYAVGDSYEGPYTIPADHLLIGSGDLSPCQSYVGRITTFNGEPLLYHHQGFPKPSLGFPKRLVQQPDGLLKAGYWDDVEKLHVRTIDADPGTFKETCDTQIGRWSTTGQNSLTGASDYGMSLIQLKQELPADIHLRCKVTTESASRWGITVRDTDRRLEEITGAAVVGDLKHGQWIFGKPVHSWTSFVRPIEHICQAPRKNRSYQVDLFVRDIYFEVYIDGLWLLTRVIADYRREGKLGFMVDTGQVKFENIHIWELEPFEHPFKTAPEDAEKK